MSSAKERKNGTVVILGDFLHEGIETTVTAIGFTLVKKTLYKRSPKTWRKHAALIKQLRETNELAAAILYLPTPTMLYACNKEFQEVWQEILTILEGEKAIVFIFDDNLHGEFGYWDYETETYWSHEQAEARNAELKIQIEQKLEQRKETNDWHSPFDDTLHELMHKSSLLDNSIGQMEEAKMKAVNIERFLESLFSSSAEIAPFRRRAEVTIRLQEFLEDEIGQGVFLKLYVPNGRYQADQFANLLKLFEDYLRRVEKRLFIVDSHRTQHGVIYVFKSKDSLDIQDIDAALSRFDEFMGLSMQRPGEAIILLAQTGIDERESAFLINKYSKEYQRIGLDSRHEFEHKSLLLKQRLETELFELANLSGVLPQPPKDQPFLTLSGNTGPIILNISAISADKATHLQSTVGQIVNGDVNYSGEDLQIIQLIDKHTEPSLAAQLKSDLDQLKDDSTSNQEKQTAKQRLVSFLYKTSSVLGKGAIDIGAKVLAAYLENLVKGP